MQRLFPILSSLFIILFIVSGVLLFANKPQSQGQKKSETPVKLEPSAWAEVEGYWSGAAEVSRYDLRQERYGKTRRGDAVLIFVREPFLPDRQVKDETGTGDFKVLKMNSTRNFLTGVYPYHTMVSVFQPLKQQSIGEAMKFTTSVQEWCGQVFMQSNRRDGKVKTTVQSYFQREDGGVFEASNNELLEDEIWTSIRLNPEGLPTGEVQMIPGSIYTRFSHRNPVPELAKVEWVAGSANNTIAYQIKYPASKRIVKIEIQNQQPYAIEAWSEGVEGGLITTAKLTNRLRNFAYWQHNNEAGVQFRSKLGLK